MGDTPQIRVKSEPTERDEVLNLLGESSSSQKRVYEYTNLEEAGFHSATNGFGLRKQYTKEELQKIEEEKESYAPFAKRTRTEEENYRYVLEQRTLDSINNIRLIEKTKTPLPNQITIKTEPISDPLEIMYYNNLNYNFFNHQYNPNLPIIGFKDQIIEELRFNNIVIIQGNTGCGKTTQVPQFIIDEAARGNYPCKIIVTQPRRIAAKSISKRVCEERNWPWGSVCGFKVSMEKKVSEDTRIFYVTTGYLLELIVADHTELEKYTHIILDEIHDRDVDTDLIILLVKILLKKKYNGKIILMSATLDSAPLVEYFTEVSKTGQVPVIKCELNLFDVKTFYLDWIEKNLNFKTDIHFKSNNPDIFDDQLELLVRLLKFIDMKEINALPTRYETIDGFPAVRGAMLIFVPGMDEINRVQQFLSNRLIDNRLVFCQLHRDIALEQQMNAFCAVRQTFRKVIISTSIAESSVTVPDIKYVIDFCLTKSPYTDTGTNYTSLKLEWTTKSNMDQRKGRAGRLDRGVCYRLIPYKFYEQVINDFPTPAIERESLEKLILNIKRFCKDPPKEVLAQALTPPALDNIERTVLFLKEAGALSLYKNREICANDGDLTYAGTIMASLPIDIKLSKLILLGHAFGRLRDAVVLAAALSCKNMFKKYYKGNFEYFKGKFAYSNGMLSDFSCILNAYNLWKAHKEYSNFTRDEMRKWTEENMLDLRILEEVEKTRKEIVNRLEEHGLKVEQHVRDIRDGNYNEAQVTDEQTAINECYLLKFMIAGAFYPNFFYTNKTEEKDIVRYLNGKDCRSTILVRGFQDSALLYHNKLKEKLKICGDNLIMHYENNKAYVEFKDFYEITNKIATGVYLSSIFNRIDLKLTLPKADYIQAQQIERDIDYYRRTEGVKYGMGSTSRITTGTLDDAEDANMLLKDMHEFNIKVVVISDLNFFWAQVDEDDHKRDLQYINSSLSDHFYELKPVERKDLFVGKLVGAFHFPGENEEFGYYRAKVIKIEDRRIHIIYIDYGNVEIKDIDLIFELSEELSKFPNQAFQCQLSHLKIDPFLNRSDDKMEKAIMEFSALLSRVENLRARVYSIVNNIVRLSLIDADNPLFEYELSEKLIKIGLFERAEESYLSKTNHEERTNKYFMNGPDGSKSRNEWINIKNLEKKINKLTFNESSQFRINTYTPLEVRPNSMTRCSRNCKVRIPSDSVNFVLLDEEPNINCSSLIVAHTMGARSDQNEIVLRNTCVFPKIKGLVSLCLLAFAPEVEFRIDEKAKKYTGALCGLGFDPHLRRPLYTENDIEDVFEVEFSERDISLINSFRTIMNCLIGSKKGSKFLLSDPSKLESLQKDCRYAILELLKEKRKVLDKPRFFDKEFMWNKINPDYLKALSIHDKKILDSRMTDQVFFMPLRSVNFNKIRKN